MLRGIIEALSTELGSLEPGGVRGTKALGAALSVALAAFVALILHSDEPWWAAISAWMMTGISLADALPRGVMRILGSIAGAAVAVLVLGLFAYDLLPFCLCLFTIAWLGLFGFAKSRHGYAWLISAITGNLVMLIALDQPQTAFTIAVNRIADVTIGTAATLLVTYLLPKIQDVASGNAASAPSSLPLLFWSRRQAREFERWLSENWLLILHACRGGLTVMVLPLLLHWRWHHSARAHWQSRRSPSWRYRRRQSKSQMGGQWSSAPCIASWVARSAHCWGCYVSIGSAKTSSCGCCC